MNLDFPHFRLPASEDDIKKLKPGTFMYLDGIMYTARDQAHKRIASSIERGEKLPFDLTGAAIYYCGPTPAPKGKVIGSCGPTTSGRMDKYAPLLIKNGLRVMIGKGVRDENVKNAVNKYGGVYFTAIGGAAALYSSCVKSCELVAYEDLGCEAVYRLEVADFPVNVCLVPEK